MCGIPNIFVCVQIASHFKDPNQLGLRAHPGVPYPHLDLFVSLASPLAPDSHILKNGVRASAHEYYQIMLFSGVRAGGRARSPAGPFRCPFHITYIGTSCNMDEMLLFREDLTCILDPRKRVCISSRKITEGLSPDLLLWCSDEEALPFTMSPPLSTLLCRRQQRPPGGNKPQQHGDHQPGSAKHNRDHQKSYQGGSGPHPSGRPTHHGYSQNRRWHHGNMKHPPGDKGEAGSHRNAKETVTVENPKLEDSPGDTGHSGLEPTCSPDTLAPTSSERPTPQPPGGPEAETKHKDSVLPERPGERPRITLLQSSKDRLRRRLKEKVPVIVFSLFSCNREDS